MKKPVAKPSAPSSAAKGHKPTPKAPAPSQASSAHTVSANEAPPNNGQDHGTSKEPAIVGDGRLPSSMMRSYALLTPDLKELYFKFYKATYGKTKLDLKTKEFVAIAASLSHGCKGCLEGHLRKAKKEGATAEEISEVIAVTLGVAAAAIVDRSDIANFHLGGLFDKPAE